MLFTACVGSEFREMKYRCCDSSNFYDTVDVSILTGNAPCQDKCAKDSKCTAAHYNFRITGSTCKLYSQNTAGWKGVKDGIANVYCQNDSCHIKKCGESQNIVLGVFRSARVCICVHAVGRPRG